MICVRARRQILRRRRRGAWFSTLLLLPFLSLLPTTVRAQQPQPQTYAGFDGQPVSEVDISARPDVDLARVRAAIELEAGKPFSDGALKRSVQALQQMRLFDRVQVSVDPQQNGVRALFILEPTDYVGAIDFPGAGNDIPYTALLQAADIPDQSPFFDAIETHGRDGILTFLRKRGYFQAQVNPVIERDGLHHVVNVTFRCVLHRRAKIRNITFNGLSAQDSARIKASLHGVIARVKRVSIKPGQAYSETRMTKSIDFIREHLRARDALAPGVRLAAPVYDAESNQVDIAFDVTPSPKVSVQVNGAQISSKALRKLVPIYQENAVDQDLVDEGQRNLNSYFQTKGYFYATTTSRMVKAADGVTVIYEVNRGSKYRETGVYFDGNRSLSDAQLKPKIYIKKGFLFLHGTYSDQLLKRSVDSITQLYKDNGFSSVSVQTKVDNFEPQVNVTFQISEGPQDKVERIELSGNATLSLPQLMAKRRLELKTGGPFSPKLMETARTQLLATYLDMGYLNAAVRSSATPDPQNPRAINVTYTVQEGPEAKISDVVLLGEKHTKASFLNEVTGQQLKPGQPLSEGHFLQSESDLYDLGIFDWATVGPLRPIVDQIAEQVLVRVHESPLNSMDIGGGIEIIPRDGSLPANAVAVPGIPPISLGDKFTVSQKSYVGPRFSFDFARHDIRSAGILHLRRSALPRVDVELALQSFRRANHGKSHLHG